MLQQDCVSDLRIATTIHQLSRVHKRRVYPKTRHTMSWLRNSKFATTMRMTRQCESNISMLGFQRHLCVKTPEQQLYLFDVFKPFSCSWDYPKVLSNLRHLVNILLLLTTFTICPFGAYAQEYSLPFAGGQFTGQSRFLSFSSKTSRDIIVTFTKNISEAIPVGELLATFRAEDKDSPSYNLTWVFYSHHLFSVYVV